MNLSLASVFTSPEPVVVLAALIPCIIAIIMWLFFFIQYDLGKLKKIREAFSKLADNGEALKECSRENISFMDEMIVHKSPPYFIEAWLRMLAQLERNYKGDYIPDGRSFYDFDYMVNGPGCRNRLEGLWRSFLVLGAATLILPVCAAFFTKPLTTIYSLALGGIFFMLLCIGFLVFTMLDQRVYFSTKSEYDRFIWTFDRVLPVAKAEVALLLEATQRNSDAYSASTQKIVEKFDTMVDDMLLPALEDSIEVIMRSNLIPALHNIEESLDANLTRTMEMQEKGMERMTSAFADRLVETVAGRISGLADTIGTVQVSMAEMNQGLQDHVKALTETMGAALELQQNSMERISGAFMDSLSNTLEARISALAAGIGNVREKMDELNTGLETHAASLMETTKSSIWLQKKQSAAAMALQNERFDKMFDRQVKQMDDITASFAEFLTSALNETVTNLNRDLGDTQQLMSEANIKMSDNIDGLTVMLTEQRRVFEESAKTLIDSEGLQKSAIEESREIQLRAAENSEQLNEQVKSMAGIIEKLSEQTAAFSKDAFKFTKETNEAQIRMQEGMQASQTRLEAAVNETMGQYAKMNSMISEMMDNITARMNEAMTNAGREIASGIKEVTADNAEAIGRLAEQAQNLRTEYDSYFSRMEGNSAKMIEDLDYQVKTIIARISEDIGAMMEGNTQANAAILEGYKTNTTDILESFDEQARSISLYAKEINMDISELSNNLQASVSDFSSKIQDGVRLTLAEFDNGLSELTHRIANTVESISDAVETLPQALKRR